MAGHGRLSVKVPRGHSSLEEDPNIEINNLYGIHGKGETETSKASSAFRGGPLERQEDSAVTNGQTDSSSSRIYISVRQQDILRDQQDGVIIKKEVDLDGHEDQLCHISQATSSTQVRNRGRKRASLEEQLEDRALMSLQVKGMLSPNPVLNSEVEEGAEAENQSDQWIPYLFRCSHSCCKTMSRGKQNLVESLQCPGGISIKVNAKQRHESTTKWWSKSKQKQWGYIYYEKYQELACSENCGISTGLPYKSAPDISISPALDSTSASDEEESTGKGNQSRGGGRGSRRGKRGGRRGGKQPGRSDTKNNRSIEAQSEGEGHFINREEEIFDKCLRCGEEMGLLTTYEDHLMKKHAALYSKNCPEGEVDTNAVARQIIKKVGHVDCPECQKEFKGAQYFLHHRKWCGREDETEKCDICGHDLKAMWIHIHKRSHAAKEKAKASQEDGTEPSSKKKRKAATVSAEEYYPPMHESSKFSIWRENSGSDPSTLQWGKAAGDKTQATGFTGGRIWGMEWCPQGHSGVSRQVIAVTTMADVDSVLMKSLWEGLGLIQFWDAGTLNCRAPPDCHTLELAFCIAHDYGHVLSMCWCPEGAFDSGNPEESFFQRLGLLAAACSDGNIRIYRRAPKVLAPCRVFFGHHDAVTSIDWSTSVATQFVTGSWDRSVKVWDTKNAKSFIFAMPGPSEAGSTIGPVRQVLLSSPSYYNLIVADEVFSRLCRGHCKGFDLSDGLTDTNAWILNCEASPMKLFSIAGVDMKADDKTSNPDDIWFPITEKEASEKLCIKFVDNQLKIDGQYQPGNRTATAEILEGIPFAYVNTVSLNPNLLSSHWIACGTRSGFLRVIHIPLLSELSETARKFFS
ncbi:hypothetical protein C0Q70_07490 [Pomacea canaliculata]|uniref:Uncharacterized protein n=1 Tax=Pomacea canaliculata TaxID=400727 RepID=A0A2T7PF85_POMCA|nr:hypothetical protein C0Q70_07490 [Pomacea canaliculata]